MRQPTNPEANARLTAATGTVLLVLLLGEMATVIMGVTSHLSLHITLGALLVGPVAVKLGATGWRMVNYYCGMPAYVRRGTPRLPLRVLGAVLAVLTIALLASGATLAIGPAWAHSTALTVHKTVFYGFLVAVALHLATHLLDAVRTTVRDLRHRLPLASGVPWRVLAVGGSVIAGAILALTLTGHAETYLHHYPHH